MYNVSNVSPRISANKSLELMLKFHLPVMLYMDLINNKAVSSFYYMYCMTCME